MPIAPLLHSLESSPLGTFLRSAPAQWMQVLQLLHVFGLLLLLATALLIGLRSLGSLLGEVPVSRLIAALRPYLLGGLAVTVLSGVLMFLSVPSQYISNPAFLPKMSLLLAATAVQAALLIAPGRRASALWARAAAGLSVALWFGVGVAGRAIAYVA
jgi:hypothetical protein